MNYRHSTNRWLWNAPARAALGVLAVAAAMFCSPAPARAELLSLYEVHPAEAFHLPGGGAPPVFDALGDGRIIAVTTTDGDSTPQDGTPSTAQVYVESGVGTRAFDLIGDLPLVGNTWLDYGASFLRVSPGGGRVAVGNNAGAVAVFSPASLSGGLAGATTWYTVDNFAAAWYDDDTLAVANLAGVEVFLAEIDGAMTMTPVVTTIVDGIPASGDVAFDGAGALYTGIGFGDGVGDVRRFALVDWLNAVATETPLDFATEGEAVTTFASASSLRIDVEGNVIIGGGRFDLPFSESNAFAVYSPSSGLTRMFDPNFAMNEDGNFYTLAYNRVTGEIYAQEPFALAFGSPVDHTLVHVIRPIPEPASWALALFAAATAALFRWTGRSRRRGPA